MKTTCSPTLAAVRAAAEPDTSPRPPRVPVGLPLSPSITRRDDGGTMIEHLPAIDIECEIRRFTDAAALDEAREAVKHFESGVALLERARDIRHAEAAVAELRSTHLVQLPEDVTSAAWFQPAFASKEKTEIAEKAVREQLLAALEEAITPHIDRALAALAQDLQTEEKRITDFLAQTTARWGEPAVFSLNAPLAQIRTGLAEIERWRDNGIALGYHYDARIAVQKFFAQPI